MGREEALVNLLIQEVAEEVNRRLPPGAAGVIAAVCSREFLLTTTELLGRVKCFSLSRRHPLILLC